MTSEKCSAYIDRRCSVLGLDTDEAIGVNQAGAVADCVWCIPIESEVAGRLRLAAGVNITVAH